MTLFQKGFLAFVAVILIAIITIAVLVEQRTTAEFRQYTALYSNRAQNIAAALVDYYAARGNWDDIQNNLAGLAQLQGQRGDGYRGGRGSTANGGTWDFQVADTDRNVIADTKGSPRGQLTPSEVDSALELTINQDVIGYFFLDKQTSNTVRLDAPAEAFLTRVRWALALGGGVAFLAALLLAVLLTRGILAPIRALTTATQTITAGNLDVRASSRGNDEIARLAETFNIMTASLQRAEQARQAQTADIAHELRNPLAVLQGTLEALADGVYAPTPDNIQPALDQVRILNRLVNDLRTLALADAGQLQLARQPMDMGQLVKRGAEAHREPFAEQGLTLQAEIAATYPTISGDYERLTQVLNNILGNAMRYVPSGGTVHIQAISENSGVTVRVVDNGPGVAIEALPRLFERFWRGDPSRSRATGGAGLGLAIARHIIEAHGGRIWAEATPGGGLTVGFWLPER